MKKFFLSGLAALFLFSCTQPQDPETGDDEIMLSSRAVDGLSQGIVTGRYYREMFEDPDSFFRAWYNADIEWIRMEFEEYNFDTYYSGLSYQDKVDMYKKLVDTAELYGIQVLGVIGYNSLYYPKPDFDDSYHLTQDSIDAYIAAVEKHITDYGLQAVEIWNEPRQFHFKDVTGGDRIKLPAYAQLLVAVYEELKPKYPDVLFVAPVTSQAFADTWVGRDHSSLSLLSDPENSIFSSPAIMNYRDANNGKLPLDVVSWHPYGRILPEDQGGGPKGSFYYSQDFSAYHDKVKSFTDSEGRSIVGDYPVWLTEYGFDVNQTRSEATQDLYYRQMIDEVKKKEEIEVVFMYTFYDDPPVSIRPDSEGYKYGMYRYNSLTGEFEPKPVFTSYVSLNSRVGMESNLNVHTNAVGYYLENGGKRNFGQPREGVSLLGSLYSQSFSGGEAGLGVFEWTLGGQVSFVQK
ncbi:MAG: hypothetical protein JXR86_18035 [Spirochaetales bacterium]|nr:hypothetical protein [Spirochaetales bacterium]